MSATHEAAREHAVAKTSSNRAFGLTVGGIMAALGLLRAVFGDDGVDWLTVLLWLVAAPLLLLAMIAPQHLAGANRAWMKLGELLARIVNPVVLLAVFALTIVPIGLMMRLFGKRPLAMSPDAAATSYWNTREPMGKTVDSLRNQF
ncbi:MAG: SxtJ family membrane protein [Geminicoccaceae bacterium]